MPTKDLSVDVTFNFPSRTDVHAALLKKYPSTLFPISGFKFPAQRDIQKALDLKYPNVDLKVGLQLSKTAFTQFKSKLEAQATAADLDVRIDVKPDISAASLRRFKTLTELALKGSPLEIPVVLDFKEGRIAAEAAAAGAVAGKAFSSAQNAVASKTSIGLRTSGADLKPVASIFDPKNVVLFGTLGAGLVALGGAFGLAARQGAALGKELQAVSAFSNATAREIGVLKTSVLDLASGTIGPSFAPQELAEAAKEAVKAGLDIRQTISALPSAVGLAGLGDTNLKDSILTIAQALNIFNLEAEEAGRVTKNLLGASLTTQADVKQISDAFIKVAPTANVLGIEIEELSGALAILAENGLLGATAGTQLNNVFNRFASKQQNVLDELARLGVDPFAGPKRSFIGLSNLIEQYSEALRGATEEEKAVSAQIIFGSGAKGGRNAALILVQDFEEAGKRADDVARAFDGPILSIIKANDNLSVSANRVKNSFLALFAAAGSNQNFADPLKRTLEELQRQINDPSTLGALEKLLNPVAEAGRIIVPNVFEGLRSSAPFLGELSAQIQESSDDISNLILNLAKLANGFGSGLAIGVQTGVEVLGNFSTALAAIPQSLQQIAGQLAGGAFVGKALQSALFIPPSVTAQLTQYENALKRLNVAQRNLQNARFGNANAAQLQALGRAYESAQRGVAGLNTTLLQANRVAGGISRVLPGLTAAAGLLGDNSEAATAAVTSLFIALEAFYALQGLTGTLKGIQTGIAGVGAASTAAGASAAAGGAAATLGTVVPILGGLLAGGAAAFAIFGNQTEQASAALVKFADDFIRVRGQIETLGVGEASLLGRGFIEQLDESDNLKEFNKFARSKDSPFAGSGEAISEISRALLVANKDLGPVIDLTRKFAEEGSKLRFQGSRINPGGGATVRTLELNELKKLGATQKQIDKLIEGLLTGKEKTITLPDGSKFSSTKNRTTGIIGALIDSVRATRSQDATKEIEDAISQLSKEEQKDIALVEASLARQRQTTLREAQRVLTQGLLGEGLFSPDDVAAAKIANGGVDPIAALVEASGLDLTAEDIQAASDSFFQDVAQLDANIRSIVSGALTPPSVLIEEAFNKDTKKINFGQFSQSLNTALEDFQKQMAFTKGLIAFGFEDLGSFILTLSPEIAKSFRLSVENGELDLEAAKGLNETFRRIKDAYEVEVDGLQKDFKNPAIAEKLKAAGSAIFDGLLPGLSPEQKDAAADALATDVADVTALAAPKIEQKIADGQKGLIFRNNLKFERQPGGGKPEGGAADGDTEAVQAAEAGASVGDAFNEGVVGQIATLGPKITQNFVPQIAAFAAISAPIATQYGRFLGITLANGIQLGYIEGIIPFSTAVVNTGTTVVDAAIPVWQSEGARLGDSLATSINSSFAAKLRIAEIIANAVSRIKTSLDSALSGGSPVQRKRQGGVTNFPNRNSGLVLMHHGEGVLPPETMKALGSETFEAMRTRAWIPNKRIGNRLVEHTTTNARNSSSTSITHNNVRTEAPVVNYNQEIKIENIKASDPMNQALLIGSRVRASTSRLVRGR
jgi:TP901 family phage tail tape measure protein